MKPTKTIMSNSPPIGSLGRLGGVAVGGWNGNGGGAAVAPPDEVGLAFESPVGTAAPDVLGGFVE